MKYRNYVLVGKTSFWRWLLALPLFFAAVNIFSRELDDEYHGEDDDLTFKEGFWVTLFILALVLGSYQIFKYFIWGLFVIWVYALSIAG